METLDGNAVHENNEIYVEYPPEVVKETELPKTVENATNSDFVTVRDDKSTTYSIIIDDVPVVEEATEEVREELYVDESDQNHIVHPEGTSEYIEVCDPNCSENTAATLKEENDSKKVLHVEPTEAEEIGETPIDTKEKDNSDVPPKNYKTVILEDWDIDIPHSENSEIESPEKKKELIVEVCNHSVEEGKNKVGDEDLKNKNEKSETVVGSRKENNEEGANENSVENRNEGEIIIDCNQTEKGVDGSQQHKSQAIENNAVENNSQVLNVEDPKYYEHHLKPILEKNKTPFKYSSISVTKKDIVDILDSSVERVERPILGGKDIFFSIELAKRLNQKLSPGGTAKRTETTATTADPVNKDKELRNNNARIKDHQDIIDILEADEVKDWKPVSTRQDPKEDGNDLEISQAIRSMEQVKSEMEKIMTPEKKPPKKKKKKELDKDLERSIALQQLREEFPSLRKRSRTTKKVNHIPFLASTILEKALTSEVAAEVVPKPNSQRRRPCYLPENVSYSKKGGLEETKEVKVKNGTNKVQGTGARVRKRKLKKENEIDLGQEKITKQKAVGEGESNLEDSVDSSVSTTVVRTYSAKRKSTDVDNEAKPSLEVLSPVTKETKKPAEEPSEPKKPKTVKKLKNRENAVKRKKKIKPAISGEIQRLLGDEGAIRMIYDMQQNEVSENVVTKKKSKTKTSTGLRKDLMLKTKLVKNAVMRLSGIGSEGVSLRGKRRTKTDSEESPELAPLFASSTPNVVFYKPKKKQRAEASRILYRHSSSESFESSEGFRRTSFDADGLNLSNIEDGNLVNGETNKAEAKETVEVEKSPKSTPKFPRRTKVVLKKRLKRLSPVKTLASRGAGKVPKEAESEERVSTDSRSTSTSKLLFSSIPVRKSSRPRMVSKKYSIWSSRSMDSLSAESLGLKKPKKASHEFAKKLNCKELIILQHGYLVQVVLATVTPVLKNSFNPEVLCELTTVFNFLSDQESCRVVLLTSTGSTFCQGVDLNVLLSSEEPDRSTNARQLIQSVKEFVNCLANFKKPVVAGVQAAAVGLGVTILPLCDVVISSDKASFFTPYTRLGQVAEGGATATFPRISRLLISELFYKCQKITGTDAMKLGLVSQVLPEERFEEELMLISRSIASQSWQAMESIKTLTRRQELQEFEQTLELECDLLLKHWTSPEFINNLTKIVASGEFQLRQLDDT